MRVGAGCLSGGGVTFIDRLRRWPLLACVNGPPSVAPESDSLRGGSGDARGGPGEPSGVENEPPGSSKSSLRRSQLGFRKPNVVSTRSKLPSPKRSRGEAPPGPATRRPSKTLRWRHANVAPLKHGKAPSGRSPTKCGDEVNQHDGGIVARQCGPRWCVVGAKPRQILAIVATLSGGMVTWRCGSSVKRRNGTTRNFASL